MLALGPATTAKTLIATETPSSIFASIPIVLANDITDIFLAREKSSDTGCSATIILAVVLTHLRITLPGIVIPIQSSIVISYHLLTEDYNFVI